MAVVTGYAQGEGEIEVVCDDDLATVARLDWLLANGYDSATAARRDWLVANGYEGDGPWTCEVEPVYDQWVLTKGTLSVFERDLEVEMEAIEYFNPYSNGTNRPSFGMTT